MCDQTKMITMSYIGKSIQVWEINASFGVQKLVVSRYVVVT